MMNQNNSEICEENTIYAVQSYNVITYFDNIEIFAKVYIENAKKLTETEIKDKANVYLEGCGVGEDHHDALTIEVLRLEEIATYYTTQQLFFSNYIAKQTAPNGLSYTVSDFDIQPRNNDQMSLRFIREWENGLKEDVKEILNWNDVFAFHQGKVLEVLSKEHIPNTIYAVQSYNVIAHYDKVKACANVYIENATKLTDTEIKDEANGYFEECGLGEEYHNALSIEILQLEEKNATYYTTEQLYFFDFTKAQVSPTGLTYMVTDFDIQPDNNQEIAIRFIRTWENGLKEDVEEELNWNDVFAFHQGTVIEVLSNEHIQSDTSL